MLSKEQLLGRSVMKTVKVDLDRDFVMVRELSGVEREKYLDMMSESGYVTLPKGLQQELACWCVVDENGERVFNDDDVERIGQMSGSSLQKISLAILRVSGLTDDGVGELEKNSEGDLSAVPGSDSPKLSAAQ